MEYFYKKLKNKNSIEHQKKRFHHLNYQNENFSLNFAFDGEKIFQTHKKTYKVYPDCFLPLNEGTSFESMISSDNYINSFTFSFDNHTISDVIKNLTYSEKNLLDLSEDTSHRNLFPAETLLPLKTDILYGLKHIKYFIEENVNDDFLLEEYLNHILINYVKTYHENICVAKESLDCLKSQTKNEILKRLLIAKEYIYYHYNEKIELIDIAEISCLSVNHLIRNFKQAFKESPYQFLTKTRLKRSNFLIENSQEPLSEIVNQVGFECQSSFIRLYKKYYGITPGEKRKKLINNIK